MTEELERIEAVIFDWTGTLYARNKGPYADALPTLEELKRREIKMCLVSLGKDKAQREREIKNSGLEKYFALMIIEKEKTDMQYFACINQMNTHNRITAVVDDRTV